jgi:toxin YoeB
LFFDSSAFYDFCHWSLENQKVFDKKKTLIKNIDRTPFKGIGKPEPLKFNRKGYWSRKIK